MTASVVVGFSTLPKASVTRAFIWRTLKAEEALDLAHVARKSRGAVVPDGWSLIRGESRLGRWQHHLWLGLLTRTI